MANKENPLISIICPTLNSEEFLSKTLNSVTTQSYKNWELIIIDGGSVDSTREIVKRYEDKNFSIAFYTYSELRGPGHARNYGIRVSNGSFIAFLDSDDIWCDDKLASQIFFMMQRNLKFTYTKYDVINKDGVKKQGPVLWKNYDFSNYFSRRGIANSSVILRRDLLTEEALSNSYSGFAEDTLLWLMIMKNGHTAYLCPKKLLAYRRTKTARSSETIKNSKAVLFIYRRVFNKMFLQILYLYPAYILDVFIRSRFQKLLRSIFPSSFV